MARPIPRDAPVTSAVLAINKTVSAKESGWRIWSFGSETLARTRSEEAVVIAPARRVSKLPQLMSAYPKSPNEMTSGMVYFPR